MSDSEQYNGWANRETWAFWLWVTNDQGWYEMVKEEAESFSASIVQNDPDAEPVSATMLGEHVVDYVGETLAETLSEPADHSEIAMMLSDIGSFWRIDYAEIGAAARELVSE